MNASRWRLGIACLLLLILPSAAVAQHLHSSRQNVASTAPAGGRAMLYFGGPILSKVKIVAVLWDSGVHWKVKRDIGQFFAVLSDSTYIDFLDSEYNTFATSSTGQPGTKQYIHAGKYLGTFLIEPAVSSNAITDLDIQVELERQIDIGELPKNDKNTVYMVYFPPGVTITVPGYSGTSCQDFCAYHNFDGQPAPNAPHIFYGVIPDISAPACFATCGSTKNIFDSVTSLSSHELAEAITDPFPASGFVPSFPQGWNSNGAEIGDFCQFNNSVLVTPQRRYVVQNLWDNSTGACTTIKFAGD